ncbi:magnesium/cobalt transporter CorA [Aeribacillus composti]|uniref:Magnesium transport protein CorA n=1 Tax=Aeribacillus composti TaxID=1868734 RepID=A0ABY9WE46_9BACI|nr:MULTISPECIES: magnesium/cobalt transporter CorA [Aeribacillus]MED0652159.1 magnesium/cobalt transporter CorA [Aeribacillus composti]MED0717064.1 magnesium/cobalt transporter CorA [Aeribacillus composti]MED0746511.1 magnesium/cobalt transporter CorA [Aeribacillus composti]MED4487721.1 magnesium/cobalt transporter CorA [Aeribacillus pallidus]WNF34415.1 magnesium/cobalt transporter CorA [Aeribacillus composti]
MIRTLVITTDLEAKYDVALKEIRKKEVLWYWVDFYKATENEIRLLGKFFHFHPLSIEDCVENVERPKIDFYDSYMFVVLHGIHQQTLEPEELDLFVNEKGIVTFHKNAIRDLNNIWLRIKKDDSLKKGPMKIMHQLTDKLVDDFFPPVYHLEDLLNQIEENNKNKSINELMKELFSIRSQLSKIRRTIIPMRDLMYRIISSNRLNEMKEEDLYFYDVYDHLLKLVEMTEANRELAADIRDSYLSYNSNRMNTIMMTLTVISSIFMPLTFIAGIYGMNFEYMPELKMKYGYYIVLGVMALIGTGMLYIFYKMGWFRFHKGPKL